ncbi:hypothetical protein ACWGN5_00360 [Streptomyces sp. NPDC055815]
MGARAGGELVQPLRQCLLGRGGCGECARPFGEVGEALAQEGLQQGFLVREGR